MNDSKQLAAQLSKLAAKFAKLATDPAVLKAGAELVSAVRAAWWGRIAL